MREGERGGREGGREGRPWGDDEDIFVDHLEGAVLPLREDEAIGLSIPKEREGWGEGGREGGNEEGKMKGVSRNM
jgi:hypothetical protein